MTNQTGDFYRDKYRARERDMQLKKIVETMRLLNITIEEIAAWQDNNVSEDRIRLLNVRKRQGAKDDGRRRRQALGN